MLIGFRTIVKKITQLNHFIKMEGRYEYEAGGGLFGAPDINMPKTEPVIAPAPASEEATVVKAVDETEAAALKKKQLSQGAKSLSIPIGTL